MLLENISDSRHFGRFARVGASASKTSRLVRSPVSFSPLYRLKGRALTTSILQDQHPERLGLAFGLCTEFGLADMDAYQELNCVSHDWGLGDCIISVGVGALRHIAQRAKAKSDLPTFLGKIVWNSP